MKCKGLFVFKTFTHRPAGKFTVDGEEKEYKSAYVLKVDEIVDNDTVNERKFKIAEDKPVLINTIKEFEMYQKINIIFNVKLYSTGATIEVSDVEVYNENEDY